MKQETVLNDNETLARYTDRTTAYGGIKRANFVGKGRISCSIASLIFDYLEAHGIKTYYLRPGGERENVCRKVDIIPIHFIVRNFLTGSTAEMLGLEPGYKPANVVYELKYENPGLGCPLINEYHATALGIVTREEMEHIMDVTSCINDLLVRLFDKAGIRLVDYRVDYGRTENGDILLAKEITPDTSRMWDEETGKCLDKDRYRHDLGNICDAYQEVLDRLRNAINNKI